MFAEGAVAFTVGLLITLLYFMNWRPVWYEYLGLTLLGAGLAAMAFYGGRLVEKKPTPVAEWMDSR